MALFVREYLKNNMRSILPVLLFPLSDVSMNTHDFREYVYCMMKNCKQQALIILTKVKAYMTEAELEVEKDLKKLKKIK
jgi:hypothetical protein